MTTTSDIARRIEHETGYRRTLIVETVEQLHNDPSLDNIEQQLVDLINHIGNNYYDFEFDL